MKHPYKTREGGATVTIFVPYDCKNHCPFCINKGEYADLTGFSAEKICQSIRRMDAITPRCDFVFTGGEPLADLVKIVRKNIKKEQINALPNGLICLKGGELAHEILPFRNQAISMDLKDHFKEEFFETKKVVYVPL